MRGPARVARAPFGGRRVLLGVTGGIAAFKAISVARELTLAGAEVDVVLTSGALDFVRPLSFEALTGRASFDQPYLAGDPLLHIRLAREADLVLIAPATANFIARAAMGRADDLLTAVLLATRAPVVFCPAMNDRMYEHPAVVANVRRLEEIGYLRAGPGEGMLAWGEGEGRGRMLEPEAIVDHAARALVGETALRGRRVLVTAGGTREALDPVRYLGNRSSGRMGFALAAAAWRAGAEVTLITAPSHLASPTGVERVDVVSAAEMHEAVERRLPTADVLIMAAAVADFRPADVAGEKIKKGAGDAPEVRLEPTVDILQATRELRPPGSVTVGFALETQDVLANARRKLAVKNLDLLALNDAREPGAGFEVETNRVTLIGATGETEELPLLSKDEVADRILHRVGDLLTDNGA